MLTFEMNNEYTDYSRIQELKYLLSLKVVLGLREENSSGGFGVFEA